MTILITGAAGFIGFHLAERLLAAGDEIVGVDSINDYYDVTLKERRLALLSAHRTFRFERMDLADVPATMALLARVKPRIVIHLAAQAGVRYSLTNPHAYTRANIDGFLAVLEATRAHPVHHLIYASSSSVYGANTKVPFHEDDPVTQPVSLYATTKRANELMAETYAHLFQIPLSGLRFFTVYGPWGRPDMAYYSFTKAIIEGQPISVFNDGHLKRDFTYVDDVVLGIQRLLDEPPARAAPKLDLSLRAPHILYNIGNHTPVALGDFITTIEQALGRTALKRYLPMQQGDVLATYADVTRLAMVTGFRPSTPLSEGIRRFVAWYKTHNPT
jgi:UDP-glucuronate 4-epimerase